MAALPVDTKEQRRMKEILRVNCAMCHSIASILQHRYDEQGWFAMVDQMAQTRPLQRGFADALKCFEQALVEQPDYVEALAGTAMVHATRAILGWAPPIELMPTAKRLALSAVAMDESVAEAHFSLAHALHYYDWDWSGAEREYRRAIELNPGLVDAYSQFSNFLAQMGSNEEAIDQVYRALEVDPLDLAANEMLAQVLIFCRQFDSARDQTRKTLELEPTYLAAFYMLANAEAYLGKYEAALEACNQGLRHSADDPYLQATYGWICGKMGRRQEARSVAVRLEQRRNDGYFSASMIGRCYLGLGDIDRSLAWFETAYEERDGLCCFLARWPLVDPVRSDPRFQALLKKMNFPAQG